MTSPPMKSAWHALEVKTGKELAVSEALESVQGALGYVPTYIKEVIRRGKRAATEKRMIGLPGYVLIEVCAHFCWSAVLELDYVHEPIRKAAALPGDYHVIPEESIIRMRELEEENFGELVRRPGSDPVQVGSIISRLVAGNEVECEVVSVNKTKARAIPKGYPEYFSVDVSLNELQRA